MVIGKTETKLAFSSENTVIKNSEALELLGVTVDDKMNACMLTKFIVKYPNKSLC